MIEQERLARELEIISKIADRFNGVYSPELVDSLCLGLSLQASPLSLTSLILKACREPATSEAYAACIALAANSQKNHESASQTSAHIAVMMLIAGDFVGPRMVQMLLAVLILSLPSKGGSEMFDEECDKLRKAEIIAGKAGLEIDRIEGVSGLVFAHHSECSAAVATEYANNLPEAKEKALIHDTFLLGPFLTETGLRIPDGVTLQPITPEARKIVSALHKESPLDF